MNVRYCPSCGAKTEYLASKPKCCSSCGKPFEAVFALASSPAAPTQVVLPPYQEQALPPQRVYRNARGEDISHLYQRPSTDQRRFTDSDDYYDRDAAAYEAQQLAASIRGTVKVGLDVDDDERRPIRLGSLPNIQKAVADANQSASKATKKRSKK